MTRPGPSSARMFFHPKRAGAGISSICHAGRQPGSTGGFSIDWARVWVGSASTATLAPARRAEAEAPQVLVTAAGWARSFSPHRDPKPRPPRFDHRLTLGLVA